jgi:hypothetical protein
MLWVLKALFRPVTVWMPVPRWQELRVRFREWQKKAKCQACGRIFRLTEVPCRYWDWEGKYLLGHCSQCYHTH